MRNRREKFNLVIVMEDERCGGTRSQQVFLSPGGDMDSSGEEDYLDIPGVVLYINYKVYTSVCEVRNASNSSIIESD